MNQNSSVLGLIWGTRTLTIVPCNPYVLTPVRKGQSDETNSFYSFKRVSEDNEIKDIN